MAYCPLASQGNFGFTSEKHVPVLQEPKVLEIAKSKAKTPVQVLLRFLLQLGVSAVPKSVKPERIQENYQVFDFSLSEEEMQALKSLNKGVRLCAEPVAVDHKYFPFNDPF